MFSLSLSIYLPFCAYLNIFGKILKCVGQNTGPTKMTISWSPEPVNMLDYMEKEIKFGDGIKVADHLVLR